MTHSCSFTSLVFTARCQTLLAADGRQKVLTDQASVSAAELTYEEHVRPIFKAMCFQCHGEEKELQGALDVRLVRLMRAGGQSGPAVVPGDAAASLLWRRIDSDEMPEGSKKLSDDQKAIIGRWIQYGANTARAEPDNVEDARFSVEELQHWSYQPVTRPQVPTPDGYSLSTPVDGFIAQRLNEHDLSFSSPADRRTLIRRATFDLTGLPPTPDEVNAFVDDMCANAFPRLVERLLASPRFGVRWGRHWLEVAGFAETDGVEGQNFDAFRRTIFLEVQRGLPLNVLSTFDQPDMTPNCEERSFSTVATQSLWFLNDATIVHNSETLARLLFVEHKGDSEARLEDLFIKLFAVPPTPASREIMGPIWKFHRHGACGMELSELLPQLGQIADDVTLIRSMHTGVNNHLPSNFALNISRETAATHKMYGIDQKVTRDYGTRCLIARRLVERGVRFVQILCHGQVWDHHGSIATALPVRCAEIDKPAAALVTDLKQRGLLDSTLVHWGGEMGRLPVVQFREGLTRPDKVGRDHNTYGFSMWVAGGGFKQGHVHGSTDDFSHHAVDGVVNHYDWLATVIHLFGLNHEQLNFRVGPREIRLIENADARVVHELLT